MTDPDQPFQPPGGTPDVPSSYSPVEYPEYPAGYPPPSPSYPAPSAYPGYPSGYPPSYQAGYQGYPGVAPGYGGYDPYQAAPSSGTNGMAIGSLVTSIAAFPIGIPLMFLCGVGAAIPIVGIVLGIVAMNQTGKTGQSGRGMAIAGIAIGAAALVVGILIVILLVAIGASEPTY